MKHIIKLESSAMTKISDSICYFVNKDNKVSIFQSVDNELYYTEADIYTQNDNKFFAFEIDNDGILVDTLSEISDFDSTAMTLERIEHGDD
ncbi:hypothetical protein RRL34_004270 [Vibrio parahaemolyticus]|nr:hypothetical protein [Vibrio parahaemolyticus]